MFRPSTTAAWYLTVISDAMRESCFFISSPSCSSALMNVYLKGLSADLADVMSQTVFYISRFVKASLHQFLDPLLRGRAHDRGKAHIPLGCNFEVRRQAGHVDEVFGLGDRPLVERCDPGCERVHKPVEVRIGQRPLDLSLKFVQIP